MNKHINNITAILSLSFISVFGILTLLSEKLPTSFNEDRELAETPVVDMKGVYDGSVTKDLSSYITDHFAGRRIWVAAKTGLQTDLSESIVNGVYVSRKRLLDVEGLQRDTSQISRNAEICNAFSEVYEGTVYFAAIPTSTGVYGDVLPTHVSGYSEKQQITDLYEALGNDIRKIDAYDILKMVKDNYIYYRNDTKWTSYGAYCVYKTVVQKLGFSPISYDKFSIEHVTDKFRGNLYNRTLSTETTADTIDIYSYMDSSDDIECQCIGNDGKTYKGCIFDRSKLDSSNMYSMYLGDTVPVMKIKTNVNNDRKLLVIKDSYGDCFIPFLLQHYGEIAVVSPDVLDKNISQAIDINEYGQTLFLFGIESLENREALENIIERT
jgi:hypothetical protein